LSSSSILSTPSNLPSSSASFLTNSASSASAVQITTVSGSVVTIFAAIATGPTSIGLASALPTSQSSSQSTLQINTLAIGLGVGLGVPLVIVGAIALFFTWSRCVQRRHQPPQNVLPKSLSSSAEQNLATHYVYTNSIHTLAKELEFESPSASPRDIQEMHTPDLAFTGSGAVKRTESLRFQEMPT
jgi:hypothetical protein